MHLIYQPDNQDIYFIRLDAASVVEYCFRSFFMYFYERRFITKPKPFNIISILSFLIIVNLTILSFATIEK